MSIRQVCVNDYTYPSKPNNERLIVSEFAGKMVLKILNDDGTSESVRVDFDDVERAWQAVKR